MREQTKVSARPRLSYIIIAFLIILAAYAIIGFCAAIYLIRVNFARVDTKGQWDFRPSYDDFKGLLPRGAVSFDSGGNTLNGHLYGGKDAKGLIIYVHGFGSSESSHLGEYYYLAQHGWLVLAYDGTGVDGSEGKSRASFFQAVYDLKAAVGYASSDPGLKGYHLALIGHSQGGFAVCEALAYEELSKVSAAVSIASPISAERALLAEGENIYGAVAIGLVSPFLRILDYKDFSKSSPTAVDGINSTNIPVLVAHGKTDAGIPIDKHALIAYMSQVTNPNCEPLIMSDPENSAHNSVLDSKEAVSYRGEAEKAFEEHFAGVKDPSLVEIRAWAEGYGLDLVKAREANGGLYSKITGFIERAIASSQ